MGILVQRHTDPSCRRLSPHVLLDVLPGERCRPHRSQRTSRCANQCLCSGTAATCRPTRHMTMNVCGCIAAGRSQLHGCSVPLSGKAGNRIPESSNVMDPCWIPLHAACWRALPADTDRQVCGGGWTAWAPGDHRPTNSVELHAAHGTSTVRLMDAVVPVRADGPDRSGLAFGS